MPTTNYNKYKYPHHVNPHIELQLLARSNRFQVIKRKKRSRKRGLFSSQSSSCCKKFKLFLITFLIVLIFIAVFSLLVIFIVIKPFSHSNLVDAASVNSKTTPVPIDVNLDECGLAAYTTDMNVSELLVSRKKRIINGEEAIPHSFPWLISIRSLKNRKISTHICTGALIYDLYVLTAAHCVSNYTAYELLVLVGLHSLNEVSLANVYLVERVWSHESFDRNSQISHDIALLRLVKPVKRSYKVSIACFSNYDPTDERVVVAGWGSVSDGFNIVTAKRLQQTMMTVLSPKDSRCRMRGPWDPNSTYCILDLGYKASEDLSNTCFGAPIMGYKNGRWYIYGLVSYVTIELNLEKKKRCLPYYPSYSTKISTYYSWIMSKIE